MSQKSLIAVCVRALRFAYGPADPLHSSQSFGSNPAEASGMVPDFRHAPNVVPEFERMSSKERLDERRS